MNIGYDYVFFLSLFSFSPFFSRRRKIGALVDQTSTTRNAVCATPISGSHFSIHSPRCAAPVECCSLSMVSITAKRACQDKDTSRLPARLHPLSPLLYYRVFWRCPKYPSDFRSFPPFPLYFFVFLVVREIRPVSNFDHPNIRWLRRVTPLRPACPVAT